MKLKSQKLVHAMPVFGTGLSEPHLFEMLLWVALQVLMTSEMLLLSMSRMPWQT